MVKSPAYSYYPDAFEQGTATMTLAAVGGYQRLLNHQWATGSVPGDDPKQLAKIMRCTVPVAIKIFNEIRSKFVRDEQCLWRNIRMEKEREKQQRRASALSKNGAKGGRPESYRFSGNGQKTPDSDNLNESLPSPSPSLERTPTLPPSRGRRRRIHPTVQAEAEQIRKSQEVKRLVHTEGLTFVEASRRVGFT